MSSTADSHAPTAVVVSIGEELLEGRIQDTNASTFAAELLHRGFHVVAMHTVGDVPGQLAQLLLSLRGTVDVVLSTGGLGPTEDDRVREEVASVLGGGLVPVPVDGAEDYLREVYARFHPGEPPSFFLDQAKIPEGAQPLHNAVGTAWAFQASLGGRTRLYVLPGPPRECAATFFQGGVVEDIQARFLAEEEHLAHGVLHTTGAAESIIEKPIRRFLQAGENPRMGITASVRGVSLSLLARSEPGGRSARQVLEERLAELQEILHPYAWGRDGQTLASVVVGGLREAGQGFSCAESCTGGLLAGAITDVPGSSRVFTHGWVTYGNEAKVDQLGVPMATLESVGAVSSEVAVAMAEGARERSGSDWAIGITGIAGPGGGTEDKPVGTVFLALVGPETCHVVQRKQFGKGGREFVRRQTVRDALDLLRRALSGIPLG